MEDIAQEGRRHPVRPLPGDAVGRRAFRAPGARSGAVWLGGVEPDPALTALRDRIEAAAVRAGQPPEGRKFRPHVTVARLDRARPAEVRDWLAANTLFRAVPFTVARFALFSSTLGRSGPSYRVEWLFPPEVVRDRNVPTSHFDRSGEIRQR